MARKVVKLWYDREGDYLEVLFERKAGYFRETASPHVMEKVDDHGKILVNRFHKSREDADDRR